MTDSSTLDAPRDLEALLPWYLNGTVSPDERAAIEAWLAEDEDARLLLDAMRDEQEVAGLANLEVEVPDAEAGLAALMREIDREAPLQAEQPEMRPRRETPIAKPTLFERVAAWLPSPGLRLAAGVAGVLVVVQAAAIAVMLIGGPGTSENPADPGFQVASGGGDAVATVGPRFLMTFQGAMTIDELGTFLDEYKLRLVDSPAPAIFEVELTGETSAVDVAALETVLQDDSRVQLLGRSD